MAGFTHPCRNGLDKLNRCMLGFNIETLPPEARSIAQLRSLWTKSEHFHPRRRLVLLPHSDWIHVGASGLQPQLPTVGRASRTCSDEGLYVERGEQARSSYTRAARRCRYRGTRDCTFSVDTLPRHFIY
jgi:hypothetical protein